MVLELSRVGLATQNIEKTLEFYRRLGVAIPEGSEGKRHVGVKMGGNLPFFLNSMGLTTPKEGPRVIFEFSLKERRIVDAKYNELIGFGYQSHRAPFVFPFNVYFAMINDPDGNIVLLSAD
jgi:catechol 2,3-dioxygenase-like lactoylglutathione lyase family enzyme